jgi:hypothetical protein
MAKVNERLEQLRAAKAKREEEERAAAEAAELAELERDEKVSEALAFWRGKVGADVRAVLFDAQGGHFFIVTGAGANAWKAWNKSIGDAAVKAAQKAGGKLDGMGDNTDAARAYVVEGILQHNAMILDPRGLDGADVESEDGAALQAFLRANPQIVNQLQGAIQRLDNASSEERKS